MTILVLFLSIYVKLWKRKKNFWYKYNLVCLYFNDLLTSRIAVTVTVVVTGDRVPGALGATYWVGG